MTDTRDPERGRRRFATTYFPGIDTVTRPSRVGGCARCGEDHESVTFERLERPIPDDDGRGEWAYWAPCPTNGQPILLRSVPPEAAP